MTESTPCHGALEEKQQSWAIFIKFKIAELTNKHKQVDECVYIDGLVGVDLIRLVELCPVLRA